MTAKLELERFAASLRDVSLSLAKRRFWTLMRDSMAADAADSAKRLAVVRAAADEVARLAEPSARIDINGHSASSLLRAIAETGNVAPPAFEGVKGKGPGDSLIAVSPFDPHDALFAFAWKKGDQDPVFVHGYFDRSARELLGWSGRRHGLESAGHQGISKFVASAQGAALDRSVPNFADAILSRLRGS